MVEQSTAGSDRSPVPSNLDGPSILHLLLQFSPITLVPMWSSNFKFSYGVQHDNLNHNSNSQGSRGDWRACEYVRKVTRVVYGMEN